MKKNKENFAAWAEIAGNALKNENANFFCPIDKKTSLIIKVNNYPKLKRAEVIIYCPTCKINRIVTLKIDA